MPAGSATAESEPCANETELLFSRKGMHMTTQLRSALPSFSAAAGEVPHASA
jgi:hypothetical protein